MHSLSCALSLPSTAVSAMSVLWFACQQSRKRMPAARIANASVSSASGRLTSIASRDCCSLRVFAASSRSCGYHGSTSPPLGPAALPAAVNDDDLVGLGLRVGEPVSALISLIYREFTGKY